MQNLGGNIVHYGNCKIENSQLYLRIFYFRSRLTLYRHIGVFTLFIQRSLLWGETHERKGDFDWTSGQDNLEHLYDSEDQNNVPRENELVMKKDLKIIEAAAKDS